MSWTADEALKHWQKKGLLTEKKATELKKALTKEERMDAHGMPKAMAIFATVGSILVGLGIILFIGSNWADMSPVQRVLTLLVGYAVVAMGAYVTEKRDLPTVSESLWLLTDVIFGANIILLAQIFNYSLTYWQGPLLWAIGALGMGIARNHKAHIYLAVPLFILALGWFGTGTGRFFGSQFEFLGSENNLLPVLSVLGIGLVSLALLLRNSTRWDFAHHACMKWGALLVTVPMIISTFDSSVPGEIYEMTGTLKQYLVIGTSLIFAALAVWKGDLDRSESKVYLLTLAALMTAMLIQWNGQSGVGVVFDSSELLYFLYILAVFAVALWTVWIGILTENSMVVNYGLVVAAIIITVQYFSWTFALLDKSLAFILGGILLIVMTIFIERKRRKILSSFDS